MESELTLQLLALAEPSYGDFQARLMPDIPRETIIGVRIPLVRELARKAAGTPAAEEFLRILPHGYYEENNLHAFLIERIKDFGCCLAETERFLPFVDNWATCDSFSPRCFAKHPVELDAACRRWISDREHPWTVRFGIEMLMNHFLDGRFSPDYPALVAAVPATEYYVAMMEAWYFATALSKQADVILPYLTEHKLTPWVHEKTIRKAIESNRIDADTKAFLRTLSQRKAGAKISLTDIRI